ncbi:glycoside hydrolase family 26 protein [Gryllotalpicola reticulitermitis]|uniref:Glycoside hydrolase family 26 protein n=1 Tax=Gryllotalpicola reticulitermitis TaxID=1184153 RepID=A0ABV8QDH0_9MICO
MRTPEPQPVDPALTPQARGFFDRLHAVTGTAALFGQQDALAYGRRWSRGHIGRSDVRDTVGAHPAVLGFDLGRIELDEVANLDGVLFDDIVAWIQEGHANGCLITLSWHSVNPLTRGGYGENTAPNSVAAVLPHGSHHAEFLHWLDRVSSFNSRLVDSAGEAIPIVFRPFHEHSGSWFWWGIGDGDHPGSASPDEFAELWRMTVRQLRDKRGQHNLLYAISPDRSRLSLDRFVEQYLRGYPGDEWVDVLGIDNYFDTGRADNPIRPEQHLANFVATLEQVAALAQARGKLAAQTEVGNAGELTGNPDDPWTGFLARAATSTALTRRILWYLVWRNAPVPTGGNSLGTPTPDEATANDFRQLAQSSFIRFADRLPTLYRRSPRA